MLLNLSRPILTRVLLLMLFFGVVSSPTYAAPPQPDGACVGAPSGNCTS
ncbi:MAG: hypothetical protein ACPGWR_08460 [Ardenticatenaceae bacterium]